MLDVIRTYCCRAGESRGDVLTVTPRSSMSSTDSVILPEDESTVREAILSLIRFYMLRNATVDEIDAILSFIICSSAAGTESEQVKYSSFAFKRVIFLIKQMLNGLRVQTITIILIFANLPYGRAPVQTSPFLFVSNRSLMNALASLIFLMFIHFFHLLFIN